MNTAVKTEIQLFPHNLQAYLSASEMLAKTGKAAIIHPTGTGKSFIGFKFAEDYPDSVICWLSPSEYIFKTQIENLRATGAKEPENIAFFTYAKLMLMSEDKRVEIHPDYIILDEFHRCGAEMWGKGVQNLLDMYSDIPILGLSATNVRYLDNQRDMADELFDGNIASEMTLGEAIVRGILAPPKYVLSVFSYQKDLERYEKRIKRTKNMGLRDPAKRYLDAIRRTLENADGIDEIFNKHMTERTGKYIVFCANYDHMQEMIGKAPEWFAKIDKKPIIYSVYSADPTASKAFCDFKADDNTSHIRLLYAIDALNEGIHLDDISGVILLRPTVSPIIFKQQIGRALSAGKQSNPVIFDIVLNINNLYSIGAIEEEMQIATSYYRFLGNGDAIVNEHFQVIDEVQDCLALFEKLNDTLSASWSVMYEHAKSYYLENGNLEIPARYTTEDGYSIGYWIYNQRSIRKGLQDGNLTEEKIAKLDAIGMRWDEYTDISWNRNFSAAQDYYNKFGDLNIPSRYVTEDGVTVGSWLASLRTWERAGAHPKYLTDERKRQLEAIGMIWDKLDYYWEKNYLAACEFYREHRNLDIQSNYVTKDGIRLGSWIARIRQLREGRCKGTPPTAEQIARLDDIGMIWSRRIDHKWENGYSVAVSYVRANGNLDVPVTYINESGLQFGAWIQRQRRIYKTREISEERKEKLDKLGMIWDTEPWLSRFALVRKYYAEHGNLDIPQATVIDGVWIGKWLVSQKKMYDCGKLDAEKSKLISELPLDQIDMESKQWRRVYEDAATYFKENDNLKVPSGYVGKSRCRLANWLVVQRRKYRLGELSDGQIQQLDEIGFIWKLDSVWEEGFRHAEEYFRTNGDLNMLNAYVCDDGYHLGRWVFNYRKSYKGLKSTVQITENQIKALEAIGMEWNPDTRWDTNFTAAQEYYLAYGSLPKDMPKRTKETQTLTFWLNNQRKAYREGRITGKKLRLLNSIGITEEWLAPRPTSFDKGFAVAKTYYEENGNLNVSTNYQHPTGFWLGSWVDKIRKKKAELTKEQIQKLDSIGFVWEVTDNWEELFATARQYYRKHGFLPLELKQCRSEEESHICQWLRRQLLKRNEGKLTQEQIDRLSFIGMDWMNTIERAWSKGYSSALEYYKKNENLNISVHYVTSDGYPLGEWLHSQRSHKKRLNQNKIALLQQLGANGFD